MDDATLNASCLAWLERTGNAKVHGTTKRVPAEVFQEERKYLRPVPEISQAVTMVRRTVRKDNTILYNSNRYSVPLGTYHQHSEVQIDVKNDILIIKTLENEYICEHRIANGKGLLIQNRSHTRDRTSALDELQESLDVALDHKATVFLQGVRAELPRYARDQFQLIQTLIEQYGVSAVLSAAAFCQDCKLYRTTVMRDYLAHASRQTPEVPTAPQFSASIPVDDPKYHVNTQKRSLDDYAKLGVKK